MRTDLPRLRQFHRWLTLESWASTLGVAGFWLPAGPLALALGVAAVAFTPYLVVSLWRLRRVGWLAAFGGTVGGAVLGALAIGGPWAGLGGALVLLAFYACTWVLKLSVTEWLRQAEEAAAWAREKARWEGDALAEAAALSA